MSAAVTALWLPLGCTALGLFVHLGWALPWDARRSLRATIDIIEKDVEADEQLQHLPSDARSVRLLTRILRQAADTPEQWKALLAKELPFLEGSPLILTAVEQARLDRHAQRLETALVRYGRRVRFGGVRVASNVSGMLLDHGSQDNDIDLTGRTVDLDQEPTPEPDLDQPDPVPAEVDIRADGEVQADVNEVQPEPGRRERRRH